MSFVPLTYDVEIARKPKSTLKRAQIEDLVRSRIESLNDPTTFNLNHEAFAGIKEHVESLRVSYIPRANHELTEDHSDNCIPREISNGQAEKTFIYHLFELNEDMDEAELMDDGDEDDGQTAASHHWVLPCKSFDGLWESLVFDSDIKTRLMDYVKTALLFSEKCVNPSLVTFNKVILLHGPPGSGKTSLCKALAQRATIHLGQKFRYGQLVEINSHSLFSKWFSESGKLVMKMFEKLNELIEDSQSIVFLLIDEVESLAKCRLSAEASNEPSDSIRAVNALLTQIDRIKRYPNVVILTTSNIVGSIDLAFVDRADLKIFVGPPPAGIIYEMYALSINELIRVGIITEPNMGILPIILSDNEELPYPEIHKLFSLGKKSAGMSGRTLKKIPFLAYVNFVRSYPCSLEYFLKAIEKSIDIEKKEVSILSKTNL